MIGLDTNVLLRYLVHDDAGQTAAARRLVNETLDEQQQGHVSAVTMAELVWVLRTTIRVARDELAETIARLLADKRLVVQHADAVWMALDVFHRENVDFSDALIAALDRLQGCTHTVTFDRNAARIPGVVLLQS